MSFYDWSTTASNNGAVDATINWAEFQDPSTVNDSARAMMARVAEWRKDVAPTRSSTGSGNAYAVASEAGGSTAYRDGEIVTFIADRANTAGCTLNVNARGAKPFRPAIGVDFKAGEIQANQAIIAFYRSATEEFIGIGSGYHVNAMTTGLLSQSIAARLIKIGTPVLSLAPTAPAGYIRLTEAAQTVNKGDWPELNSWLSSISYPWGSTSTTFNLPPAAGYVLRFAATSSSIDTAGARTAGSTQTDAVAAHTHTFSATTSTDGAHTHTVANVTTNDTTSAGSGGTFAQRSVATATTSSSGSHSHTISGTTGSTGGSETRPRNVAMHVDIFASSQLSAGTLAMFGFPYAWDTGTTAADPGTARVRGNNATLASITTLYINETDAWGVDIGAVLGAITNGSVIRLSKVGAQANTLVMTVSGSITDSGTYRAVPVTVTAVNGSFASNDSLAFELAGGAGATGDTGPQGPPGDTGAAGADGADGADGTDPGIRWTFDSSTTMADPGAGDLRLNHATLASVTAIAVSDNCAETGNPSVESWVLAWDDSTTTSLRGTLILKKASAPENFAIYNVTGSSTDNSGWTQVAVTHVASSGAFSNADTLSVQFLRTGNTGAGAGDVVGPASSVDGEIVLFDSTTGKLLKRASTTGLVKATSGVISAASAGTDYYAPAGTDVALADGGTGASLSDPNSDRIMFWDDSAGQVTWLEAGSGLSISGTTLTATGSIGGSTGATDNAILRADGTGGATIQNSSVTIDDSGNASGLASVNTGPLAGLRNRLINGCMRINQRAAASNADDTYAFDRWNILTQSGAVAVSQLTDVENTTPRMMRITQSQASAQRFAVEQIIEAVNCKSLRGQTVTLSARVRMSASTTLRYAILEWTGTADTVTSDFVLDWTSGTFTAGNFFTSTSTTVTATGSTALTANTLATVSLSTTIGNAANNIVVIFWTDSTQAQNVTFDVGKAQFEQGSTATAFERRPYHLEFDMCRYYYRLMNDGVGAWYIGGASAAAQLLFDYSGSRPVTPTMAVFSGTNATITDPGVANVIFSSVSVSANVVGVENSTLNFSKGGGSQTGTPTQYHIALQGSDNIVSMDKEL